MPIEILIALATYAFVTSVTPGPNNIMLTASGANFGITRSIPHVVGIVGGVALMNICVGFGLGAAFEQFPILQQILKIGGTGYLIWLAIKLLGYNYVEADDETKGTPLTFWQAASFQYINPKAWVMSITANASFSLPGEQYWFSVVIIILVFLVVGPPCVLVWVFFGQLIRKILTRPLFLKFFNVSMAVLTLLCVVFIWID